MISNNAEGLLNAFARGERRVGEKGGNTEGERVGHRLDRQVLEGGRTAHAVGTCVTKWYAWGYAR
jgi:hypothetical protein